MGLVRNNTWRPARGWMIGIVAVIWLAYAWSVTSMPADGNFGPGVAVGWPNRILLVSYALWFIVTAWQALRLRRETG